MAKESFTYPETGKLLVLLDETAQRSGVSRGQAFEDFLEMSICALSGGNRGPHSLVITLAFIAASTLRNASIDHAMTNLLLGMVVRRLDISGKHKTKIIGRFIVRFDQVGAFNLKWNHRETRSKISCFVGIRWLANNF